MVQTVISQDSYSNRSTREGLTEQEEWALVAHVKERTQLLKRKKEGLTLEEKRICLRGDRAMGLLVKECRPVILAQIHRFNGSEHIPTEEMYQLGVICVERAANNHNPNKPGRKKGFKSWVSFQLRQLFIKLFDKEFGYYRRTKVTCEKLKCIKPVGHEDIPIDTEPNNDLRDKLDQIITTALPDFNVKLIQAHYWQGEGSANIAASLGLSRWTVRKYLRVSREQLKENPQIKELVSSVFSAAPSY
ncbi:sigma-70 family RNA polymerase sigma factor [Acaryochloris marina]|uniref:sigma-70 family RNA polymerase sigma factor n=1 Tax=Acaryochloris marina TaxID=155978 RepID=UPI001BB086F9|nr:sigma-70 family RNA polymerase sigma factor [Acaryochloris marina]QUY45835.1 sigma-70 family RNA polymerase sigma factor [Acaryochloris marina S15]